jgi:hypothetical protein
MAKFRVNKHGTEQLILTGNEIVLVEALMYNVRLGFSPLKDAAQSILEACSSYAYIGQCAPAAIKLGVTISKPLDANNLSGPEFEQKFSEYEPGTHLTIELENR